MKKKMVLISMFLMGLVIWGCGEKSTMKSQIAYVFATAANDGGDSYLQDLDGFVVGDPFPVVKDVSVKGLSVKGLGFSEKEIYESGFDFDFDESSVDMPNLEIEITTTEGILKGTVKKPTLYDSITVSSSSALNIGDSWTLTIHGGKSDFKAVSAEFETYDGEDYHEIDLDTVITGSTLQIPGSILNQNGYLYVYGIAMVNGPRREAGSKGNMDGDGSGFLWHSTVEYDLDYSIRIGSGSIATKPKTLSREALRTRRSNLIKKQME